MRSEQVSVVRSGRTILAFAGRIPNLFVLPSLPSLPSLPPLPPLPPLSLPFAILILLDQRVHHVRVCQGGGVSQGPAFGDVP